MVHDGLVVSHNGRHKEPVMPLNDDAWQKVDGNPLASPPIQASPLSRVPSTQLQHGSVPVLAMPFRLDGHGNWVFAEVAPAGVVYCLPRSVVAEILNHVLLVSIFTGANDDAKVDHFRGSILRFECMYDLG